MLSLRFFLLLIGVLASYAAAASAPTFCKCTCFKNSTLIQLGPQTASSDSSPGTTTIEQQQQQQQQQHGQQHLLRRSSSPDLSATFLDSDLAPRDHAQKRAASTSCTQCTRSFCLAQHLPICKDAEEESDVVAQCFQRDSRKDQIIVWAFLLGTAGLLGWAGAKRVVEMREGKKAAALGLGGLSAEGNDRGVYAAVGR
ncbi:hypothetical protein F4780DRAFT_781849 [Xylariomycetidae sp. FL0641]|nr:hypothetical protein F4780DRAFT_781849 [Xylariomycetidae sp. FL0641]